VPAVGIRREDKNEWEARAPLAPSHVAGLVRSSVDFVVQPSTIRVFGDDEYRAAGARVDDDLSGCGVVLAVKEIPPEHVRPGVAYVFYSHTIKGQPHNRGMFRRFVEAGATLIDYEKMTGDDGRAVVSSSRHAGLAGMIDALWALGRRLEAEGHDTPLAEVRQAHGYRDLAEAKSHLAKVGRRLAAGELPEELRPLQVGVLGYGGVSGGVQEILAALGDALRPVVFREEDMVERSDGGEFRLEEYYSRPELYRPVLDRRLQELTVLMNCLYWEERYPRFVTREGLRRAAGPGGRLRVIGDISCDIEGAVEVTVRSTAPDAPAYTYDPATDSFTDGVAAGGVVIVAVDNLPCELARDATEAFGDALAPLVPAMAAADLSASPDGSGLPGAVLRGTIVWRGEVTPPYAYLRGLYGLD